MGRQNYKVDSPIKVRYQASGCESGLTVTMAVFDELDVEDTSQSGTMTERGTSGRYIKSFTPDAEGEWSVEISDTEGGKVVKQFSVGSYKKTIRV